MSEIRSNFKDIGISIGRIAKCLWDDWSIRKVINFSNFLKIAFIYFAAIFWVIIIEFEYSDGFWQKAISGKLSERRLAVYSVKQRIGEVLLYRRVIKYAQMNGYDYVGSCFPEELTSHFALTAHFYKVGANILNYILKPDFNLSVTHHVSVVPDIGYNITYLNMPRDALYTPNGKFKKVWQHLNDYDVYADLYTLSSGDNQMLAQIISKSGQKKPIIPLYLSQLKTEYKELDFNKAIITGTLWGCGRNSLRVKLAIKKLAQNDLLDAIGIPEFEYLGEHYKGRMEEYGQAAKAIIEQHQKYGIAFIIHNEEHMLDGIPTSRISEAASSSAVIISDRNKFLERYFANSVLFIDTKQDENVIYQQVKEHIQWIKDNPQEAKAMTRRAYDIFVDNFTVEQQMDNLFDFVEHQGKLSYSK